MHMYVRGKSIIIHVNGLYFSKDHICELIVGFVFKACRCEVCGTYLWLDSSSVC